MLNTYLVGMCALSEVSIVASNVQNIVDFGLSEKNEGYYDFRLASYSCQALLRLVPPKLSQEQGVISHGNGEHSSQTGYRSHRLFWGK